MKLESRPGNRLSLWATNARNFFNLQNPRIFQLFITSSTVTFFLGLALLVEWYLHGQNHPEYYWIVYYALLMIIMPFLVLILCALSANFFCNDVQNMHTLPLCPEEKVHRPPPKMIERELSLPAMPTDHAHDSERRSSARKPTSLVPVDRVMEVAVDDKFNLKRTFSLKLPCTSSDYGGIKRSFSCRL